MRDFSFPHSPSKRRLLESAETLFADRGFDNVSLRDITQAAGANVAAVNYHFGGREGLIAVVVARYMTPVNEERLARLNQLEDAFGRKPVPIELILETMVRPMASMVRKSDLSERLFYKLMGRIFSLQHQGFPEVVENQMKHLSDRFRHAVSQHLPELSEEEVTWRIQFVVGAMIHTLIHQEWLNHVTSGASGSPSIELTLQRFIGFAAAGLRCSCESSLNPHDPSPSLPTSCFL